MGDHLSARGLSATSRSRGSKQLKLLHDRPPQGCEVDFAPEGQISPLAAAPLCLTMGMAKRDLQLRASRLCLFHSLFPQGRLPFCGLLRHTSIFVGPDTLPRAAYLRKHITPHCAKQRCPSRSLRSSRKTDARKRGRLRSRLAKAGTSEAVPFASTLVA